MEEKQPCAVYKLRGWIDNRNKRVIQTEDAQPLRPVPMGLSSLMLGRLRWP